MIRLAGRRACSRCRASAPGPRPRGLRPGRRSAPARGRPVVGPPRRCRVRGVMDPPVAEGKRAIDHEGQPIVDVGQHHRVLARLAEPGCRRFAQRPVAMEEEARPVARSISHRLDRPALISSSRSWPAGSFTFTRQESVRSPTQWGWNQGRAANRACCRPWALRSVLYDEKSVIRVARGGPGAAVACGWRPIARDRERGSGTGAPTSPSGLAGQTGRSPATARPSPRRGQPIAASAGRRAATSAVRVVVDQNLHGLLVFERPAEPLERPCLLARVIRRCGRRQRSPSWMRMVSSGKPTRRLM